MIVPPTLLIVTPRSASSEIWSYAACIPSASLVSNWLVVSTNPSEKSWTSSLGMMTFHSQLIWKVIQNSMVPKTPPFPMYGNKKKHVPVTTNQPKITLEFPSQCVNLSLFSTYSLPVAPNPQPTTGFCSGRILDKTNPHILYPWQLGQTTKKSRVKVPIFHGISWLSWLRWLLKQMENDDNDGFTTGVSGQGFPVPPPRDISGQTPC